ncbi:MAG: aldo/keto reductase, partial [Hasllibacter sp.]
MRMRTLGRDGPEVGVLALGTMTFGAETPEDEARAQMDRFAGAGGTLIDTADAYAGGTSEEIVGRWLRDRGGPEGLTIATKGRFGDPPGASAAALTTACENSLRRLGLERIDHYVVHGWDGAVPVEETLGALAALRRAGKIDAVGWSNVTGWQLQRIVSAADAGAGPRPVSLQPQYNLLDRGIEVEVLPCALDAGLGVTPWSPLGGGWLTGKYRADARPTGATRLGEDPGRGVEA